jgi:hypothetical protein
MTCPACTAPVPGAALECAYCGSDLQAPVAYFPPAAELDEVPGPPDIALHPMSETKLLVMSLVTFGVYQVYWFYRNWKLRNELRGRDVMAPLRAIFSGIFAYSLFEDVGEEARRVGVSPGWSPVLLGIVYFLMGIATRLPDPLWLLSFLSLIPLYLVQRTINDANARSPRPAPLNDRYSTLNRVGIGLGIICLLLVLLGLFFPEP